MNKHETPRQVIGATTISHRGGSWSPQFGMRTPSSGLARRSFAHIIGDIAAGGALSVPCSSNSRRLAASPSTYQAAWASLKRASASAFVTSEPSRAVRSGWNSFANCT
eukprot:CAMPEP_0172716280 /NCGR_PEP_ID=MMETSP1074-20121228/68025_1 /TAXON_ID=2916 /ORGANISM="Ceratium fusus, Strain PA161109" /LENGTH=107 /DNA_ID=CAMNT_0013540939 /DNA_START=279 /DNA_END=602 /DNA_ORIENTATION=-